MRRRGGQALSTEDYGLKSPVRLRRSKRPAALRDWLAKRRTTSVVRASFAALAALVDVCAITLSSVLAGVAYHALVYHVGGVAGEFAAFGLAMAMLFVTLNALRSEYEVSAFLTLSGHARRMLGTWTLTCLALLVAIFIAKATADYSRVSVLLIYATGTVALSAARIALVWITMQSAVVGRIAAARVVLVGQEAEVQAFTTKYKPWLVGVEIVASFVLRGRDTLEDDIALATASARVLRPDDVFILLPWSQTETIDACVASLVKVPAAIHPGPQAILDRFSHAGIASIGHIRSLQLVRRPLTILEVVAKRAFDLVLTVPLLVALAPVFLVVAILIKLDSKGPVFFLQRRYGFNQETFRIVKFRTMSVHEDDRHVAQAMREDPRVTRVGRALRRHSIDELPQLLNVLRGEMSIVGPRPHALAHNQKFERVVASYARRHNVKPGITGWAQAHGLRGEVTSNAAIRDRVRHDLYYIDNWSVWLDLRILAMTILSPRVWANAY